MGSSEAENVRVAQHLRLNERQRAWLRAIVNNRMAEENTSSALREAMTVGLLAMLATSPPDEQQQYGEFSGEELARRLRPVAASLLDFLARYGELPGGVSAAERQQGVASSGAANSGGLGKPGDGDDFEFDAGGLEDHAGFGLEPL